MLCGSTRTTARQMFSSPGDSGEEETLSWEHEDVGVHQMVGEGREGSSHPHRESSMQKSCGEKEKHFRGCAGRPCGWHGRRVGQKTRRGGPRPGAYQTWSLSPSLYCPVVAAHSKHTRGSSAGAASAGWDTDGLSGETQAGFRVAQGQREAKLETSLGQLRQPGPP